MFIFKVSSIIPFSGPKALLCLETSINSAFSSLLLIREGGNKLCVMKRVVYKVFHVLCEEFHLGEAARPLWRRTGQHIKAICSPQRFPDNPIFEAWHPDTP